MARSKQRCQALSWGWAQQPTQLRTVKHHSLRELSQKGDARSACACSKGRGFEGEINKPLF